MDLSRLCVTFEMSQGMATFELDFTDFQNVQCNLHKLDQSGQNSPLMAKKVFEKTLSLPLTMRSLIKQTLKRSRRDPDPDPDPQAGHLNHFNGNNHGVTPMDLDFQGHKGHGLRVEAMDYEASINKKDHLNANRPQV